MRPPVHWNDWRFRPTTDRRSRNLGDPATLGGGRHPPHRRTALLGTPSSLLDLAASQSALGHCPLPHCRARRPYGAQSDKLHSGSQRIRRNGLLLVCDWKSREYRCPRAIGFNFHLALELPEAFADSSEPHTRSMQLNFDQAFRRYALSEIPNFNVNGIIVALQPNRRGLSSSVTVYIG